MPIMHAQHNEGDARFSYKNLLLISRKCEASYTLANDKYHDSTGYAAVRDCLTLALV